MKFIGICLITDDVDRLVAFYSRVLQRSAAGDSTHAEFNLDGLGLAIYSRQGTEQMAPGSTQGAGQGGFTIILEVEDADAECARITALGIPLLKPLASYPWGARAFWFRDPDGNIVDIFSRIQP